ncbi:MAG: hypothetical protein ABW022_13575, partial [Actinoplanes sp.]
GPDGALVLTLLWVRLGAGGAADPSGTAAVHQLVTHGRWPTFTDLWATFRRQLVPGLAAGPLVLVAGALIALDVAALRRGAVPGGGTVVLVVLVATALAAGFAGLVAVEAGRAGRGAIRRAWTMAADRPVALPAAAGIVVLALVLATLAHPALLPVLAGYVLFALHVATRRAAAPDLAAG